MKYSGDQGYDARGSDGQGNFNNRFANKILCTRYIRNPIARPMQRCYDQPDKIQACLQKIKLPAMTAANAIYK